MTGLLLVTRVIHGVADCTGVTTAPSCSFSLSSSFKSKRGRSPSGFGQSHSPGRNTASRTNPKPFLSRTGFFSADYHCIPAIKLLNNFALDRPLISIIHSRRQTPEATLWFILFLYNYTSPPHRVYMVIYRDVGIPCYYSSLLIHYYSS